MPNCSKHTVNSARRLNNGGILLELDTEEATRWINSAINRLTFLTKLAPEARIKTRAYPIVIQLIPLDFDPKRTEEVCNMEETNKMLPGSIMSDQWLKPLQRREPSQEVAHALITFHSAEAANKVLTEGIIICQKRIYAEKCKKEPIRCLRCHGWNHLTYTCLKKYDTCGTCGNRHKTAVCSNHSRLHCVSCNTNDHASWDRECPTFTCKCAELDDRLTENVMPYFPTNESWTHVTQPGKIIIQHSTPQATPSGNWQRVERQRGRYKQMTLPFNSTRGTQNGRNPVLANPPADQRSPASNANAMTLNQETPHQWGDTENEPNLPTPGQTQ